MFKCQQSGVWTFQGSVPICLGYFLNNYLLDKLAVDPVFRGEEVGAGEGVDVLGGMEAGSWTEKEMMLLYC